MLNLTKYPGGTNVRGGFYWGVREWHAQVIPAEGGVLAGGPHSRHIRVPALVVLVLAPIMGAAYAMFLPFIGFAMLAMYLTGWLKKDVRTTPPAAEKAAGETATPELKRAA